MYISTPFLQTQCNLAMKLFRLTYRARTYAHNINAKSPKGSIIGDGVANFPPFKACFAILKWYSHNHHPSDKSLLHHFPYRSSAKSSEPPIPMIAHSNTIHQNPPLVRLLL